MPSRITKKESAPLIETMLLARNYIILRENFSYNSLYNFLEVINFYIFLNFCIIL